MPHWFSSCSNLVDETLQALDGIYMHAALECSVYDEDWQLAGSGLGQVVQSTICTQDGGTFCLADVFGSTRGIDGSFKMERNRESGTLRVHLCTGASRDCPVRSNSWDGIIHSDEWRVRELVDITKGWTSGRMPESVLAELDGLAVQGRRSLESGITASTHANKTEKPKETKGKANRPTHFTKTFLEGCTHICRYLLCLVSAFVLYYVAWFCRLLWFKSRAPS